MSETEQERDLEALEILRTGLGSVGSVIYVIERAD